MFSSHVLGNGTRVLLAPARDTQAVTVFAFFPVGSRYESAGLSGAAHFIEHLMFKGTTRRPTTLHISRDLDRVGAEYNAFTGKDYTGYYIKANAEHLDLALDMLADMLFHSTFKPAEVERERRVVLEEINKYEDMPERLVEERYEELLYGSHPLSRFISGTRKTMLGITRPKLLAFRDRFYHPDRCLLTIAGNVGDGIHDGAALARVQDSFGRVPGRARRAAVRAVPFRRRVGRGALRVHFKETAQVHLVLGVPAYGGDDPKTYPLALLANVLGGTMSSRLWIAVRERRGLAYTVRATADAYQDIGSFSVHAGLDPSRLDEALRTITRELRRVRDRGITAEECSRAKENIEGRIILGLEESSERAEWYGRQALLRKEVLTPEEKIARLMAVERTDVARVARELLRTDRLHLAVIGPVKDDTRLRRSLRL